MKRQQQWSALLPTPLRFRTLLGGVCLPRWIDGVTMTVLLFSVMSVGLPLRMMDYSNYWSLPIANAAALIVCTATSLFGSAFTKSPAKTGFLGVVLAVLLGIGFGVVVSWVQERFFPWHGGPRKWLESWASPIVSLAALALASIVLTWMACRRLRWDR